MPEIEILSGGNTNAESNETKKESKKESKKGPNKILTFIKKNPFKVALGVVIIAGLYVWYKSSKVSNEAVESAEGYFIPQTYTLAGSGISESYNTDSDMLLESVQQYSDYLLEGFNKELESIQTSYDNTNNALLSQIDALNEKYDTSRNIITQQSESIERQNAISKMMQNSDLYAITEDGKQRDALHEENQNIADKYGWTFGDDYYWYDENGDRLYETAMQAYQDEKRETIAQKTAASSSSSKSSSSSSSKSSSSSSSKSSSSSSSKSSSSSSPSTSKPYINSSGEVVGGSKSDIPVSHRQYIDKNGNWVTA